MYRNRYELARYFQKTGDKWLADHFFETCLKTSQEVGGDDGKMQAQGHFNVGMALEENGTKIRHNKLFQLKLKEDIVFSHII